MFIDDFRYRGESFDQEYKCYPSSFLENKEHVESGNKIIMPPSALNRLAFLHIDFPMLFELRNDASNRVSHCGVLEFVAEEGCIYMPSWMMENLCLYEEERLRVKNVALPRGEYVKLQPHTKDFLDISNPKAILEKTLRNYSCLTTGDCIMVAYNLKQYYIDIIETRPSYAISIVETDCEVDFAPPLDYKHPENLNPPPPPPPPPPARLSGEEEEAAAEPDLKFSPFSGVGRRLNGKTSTSSSSLSSSLASASTSVKQPVVADGINRVKPSQQAQGKLIFQSSTRHPSNESRANKEQDGFESRKETTQSEVQEPRFLPFTGKKYSLRG